MMVVICQFQDDKTVLLLRVVMPAAMFHKARKWFVP